MLRVSERLFFFSISGAHSGGIGSSILRTLPVTKNNFRYVLAYIHLGCNLRTSRMSPASRVLHTAAGWSLLWDRRTGGLDPWSAVMAWMIPSWQSSTNLEEPRSSTCYTALLTEADLHGLFSLEQLNNSASYRLVKAMKVLILGLAKCTILQPSSPDFTVAIY